MGPYYRGTSQGVGAFFDFIHQHPWLMAALVVAGLLGFYYQRRSKSKNRPR